MNCKDVIELLETGFGADNLPVGARQHIGQCPDCLALQQELESINQRVNQSSEFDLTDAEIESAVATVESRLDSEPAATLPAKPESNEPTLLGTWLRPLSRIAAVFLFVAATYGAYRIGQLQVGPSFMSDSLTVFDSSPVAFDWAESDSEELDDAMISALIDDFSDQGYFEAGEAIIDDLTDEEMEYFLENFDVGEIL